MTSLKFYVQNLMFQPNMGIATMGIGGEGDLPPPHFLADPPPP